MTLNAKIGGFYGFFWPFWPVRVYIVHKVAPRRWHHTHLWLMCIMVLMGWVQMMCDFQNYNYWTGNAIGFRASRELCSNFLFALCVLWGLALCPYIWVVFVLTAGLETKMSTTRISHRAVREHVDYGWCYLEFDNGNIFVVFSLLRGRRGTAC